ncbi:MAG: T9SS type A sorting domain-containing protein [Bacteroidia bacterium]
MQKFNTLMVFVASLLIMVSAQAQTPVDLNIDDLIPNHVQNQKSLLNAQDRPEGTTQIIYDYGTTSGDTRGFFWTINNKFRGNNDVDVAGVVFDSLIDANGITYDPSMYFSKLDTISWRMRTRKSSPANVNDTLVITIFELGATTVVWQDTQFLSQAVVGIDDAFVPQSVAPDLIICDHGFAVRFDFLAPIEDTLHMIATWNPGTCPLAANGFPDCGPDFSNLPGRSFYGVYSNGTRISSAVYDCNSNMVTDACEAFYIQNWEVLASVSLVDRPLDYTLTSTPDDGIGSGTATVTLTDDIPVVVSWSSLKNINTNIPDGLVAMNLAADSLLVGIAVDGINCGGTGQTDIIVVDLDDNTSIDLASAGINTLNTYPNPTSGSLTLDLELNSREDVRVQILSTTGKVIYETSANQVASMRQAINLTDVASGVYMLNVTTSRGSATQRILVN